MSGKVFINYRRDDDAAYAGRIHDRLAERFGKEFIFLDVDAIAPGLDFVEELNKELANCGVFLAIIGRRWLDAKNDAGERRLDDPADFVRLEIEAALGQDVRVIPVLVNGAKMPNEEDLPESLEALARRNAITVSHDRFGSDTENLLLAVGTTIKARKTDGALTDQELAAVTDARNARRGGKTNGQGASSKRNMAVIAILALVLIIGGIFASQHYDEKKQREADNAAWQTAKTSNTSVAYEVYLNAQPSGSFTAQAKQALVDLKRREKKIREKQAKAAAEKNAKAADDKVWQVARTQNTVAGYKHYLTLLPKGQYRTDAETAIAALKQGADDVEWQEALKTNKTAAFQSYLKNLPTGVHAAKATAQIHLIEQMERYRKGIIAKRKTFAATAKSMAQARTQLDNLKGVSSKYGNTVSGFVVPKRQSALRDIAKFRPKGQQLLKSLDGLSAGLQGLLGKSASQANLQSYNAAVQGWRKQRAGPAGASLFR